MDICKQENDRRTNRILTNTQKVEGTVDWAIRQHDTGKRERRFQSQFPIIHSKRFTLLFFFISIWSCESVVFFFESRAKTRVSSDTPFNRLNCLLHKLAEVAQMRWNKRKNDDASIFRPATNENKAKKQQPNLHFHTINFRGEQYSLLSIYIRINEFYNQKYTNRESAWIESCLTIFRNLIIRLIGINCFNHIRS